MKSIIAIIVFSFFLFDKEEVSDVKVKFIYLSFVIFREIRIDKLYCNNHSFNVLWLKH